MMKKIMNMIMDRTEAKRAYQIGKLCFGHNGRTGIIARSSSGKDRMVITLPECFVENLYIYMSDVWESHADMVSMIDLDFPIIYHADYRTDTSHQWYTDESFCMSVTHSGLFIMLDLNGMKRDYVYNESQSDVRASFGIQSIFVSRHEIRRNAMKLIEYAGKERKHKIETHGKITNIVNR